MPASPFPIEVQRILQRLHTQGFLARVVGGCVRDTLLHRTPKDYDVATTATPNEIMTTFAPVARKVIPTGEAFGTVTVIMQTLPVEVTTLRKDVSCDGRRAVVAFSQSFEEDALRRDFTINALSQDADGTIHDYCHGLVDLEQKKVRFIGVPTDRIREDYLRILRYFRFQLQLGFTGDDEALLAITRESSGLHMLSKERVTQELRAILSAPIVYPRLAEMESCGGVQAFLPVPYPLPHGYLRLVDSMEGIAHSQLFLARLFFLSLCTTHTQTTSSSYPRLALTRQEAHQLAAAETSLWDLPETQDIAIQLRWIDMLEAKGGSGSFLGFFSPIWRVALQFLGEEARLHSLAQLQQAEQDFGARRTMEMPLDGITLMEGLHIEPGKALGLLLQETQDEFRRGTWRTREDGFQVAESIWKKMGIK